MTHPIDYNSLPLLTPLNATQRQTALISDRFRFAMADQVRFFEIDALRHVNNVAYFRWFETLRIKLLQVFENSEYLQADKPAWVVSANSARYLRPVYLGQTYITAARVASFRQSSFVMEYGVFVEGVLVAEGESVQVAVAHDGSSKIPLSDELKEILTAYGAAH